jgi:uncharacterized protein YeaO (DUF488 family)
VWVPELAPSPALFSWIKSQPITDARWRTYARRYRAEMKRPSAQRLIELLAAFSKHANFSVGCYCENEARCHRSLLRELLVEAGATVS